MNVWEDQHDSGGGWPPSRGRAVVARCAWTALSVACERDASRIVHVSVARRRLRGSFAVALCDEHASFVVSSDEREHGHALRVVRVERAS